MLRRELQCWCCCVQAALLYAQYLFVELIPLTFLLVSRCAISLRCRFGALSEHRTDWARLGHALVSLHNKRGLGTFDAKDSTPFKVAWCMDSQKGEEEPKRNGHPSSPVLLLGFQILAVFLVFPGNTRGWSLSKLSSLWGATAFLCGLGSRLLCLSVQTTRRKKHMNK